MSGHDTTRTVMVNNKTSTLGADMSEGENVACGATQNGGLAMGRLHWHLGDVEERKGLDAQSDVRMALIGIARS